MKKTVTKVVTIIITTSIFVLALITAKVLLQPKTHDGILQAKCLYDQPEDSLDVVFLGSSHVHCDINTALLWKEYGIASYDYSAAEQPLWITYYYIKELLKTQSPRVLVLDTYAPVRYKDDYQYRWLNDNLCGVKMSYYKFNMLEAACEKDEWKNYFPSFANYHTRFRELGMKDIEALLETSAKRASFKGFTPYYSTAVQERPENIVASGDGITPKSEEYLRKIIKLCLEENIELVLIATPYCYSSEDLRGFEDISELAEEGGIAFVDFNRCIDEMSIDYATDFYDWSHLNFDGSCKFTSYLADTVLKNYDIPDHRKDSKWSSWDEHVLLIESGIAYDPE